MSVRSTVVFLAAALAVTLLCCPRFDDGGAPSMQEELDCGALELKVCGPADECDGSVWCIAARLLAEGDSKDPRCIEVLQGEDAFPACLPVRIFGGDVNSVCDALLALVCGEEDSSGKRPCDGTPACVNALLLSTEVRDTGDAGAALEEAGVVTSDQACASALAEQALFPQCAS